MNIEVKSKNELIIEGILREMNKDLYPTNSGSTLQLNKILFFSPGAPRDSL